MNVVETWTGHAACALQAALRMTNEGFAAHLGVAVRTVAGWHKDPEIVPRSETQQILDIAYERADASVHRRFSGLSRPPSGPAPAQALRVAIAVVVRGNDVLLVRRRGDDTLTWQFPAGMVKPGAAASTIAEQETHAETGVHCTVRERLGERVHPVTGVIADYHLCDYLAGDAVNRDELENMAVAWVPRTQLHRFIPADRIYPPITAALEGAA
ncbi:NUDIX hydrolase [Streptomyces sp. NRRL F-5135]|uniref:NUDIX hydrolase n=1 Tax=Streptomyces sp. NRRL F-5135 TaxID=1463858 RepID=UPI0004CB53A9|nr:NUDIX hydrolase [Streptomyces sp. NRRL F-5135]